MRACSDRSSEASMAALLICLIRSSPPASRSKFSGKLTGRPTIVAPSRWAASAQVRRLRRRLFENTLHHARADAELPADLEDPVPTGPQFQYSRFNSRLDATPPGFRSFLPRAR